MKRKILFLALIGVLCIRGQYSYGQISEGGTPISFSLDMDAEKGKIPVLQMPAVNAKALLEEDERARSEKPMRPFKFGHAIDVAIDLKKSAHKIELCEMQRIRRNDCEVKKKNYSDEF